MRSDYVATRYLSFLLPEPVNLPALARANDRTLVSTLLVGKMQDNAAETLRRLSLMTIN